MKKNKTIIITLGVIITSLFSLKLFNNSLFTFAPSIKLFPRDVTNNIIKKRIFDEVWDYEKVPNLDKTGYNLWIIGQEAGEISAAKIASGVIVEPVFFRKNELDLSYKSMEDYDKNNGAEVFRKFIDKKK